jgi:hypothetical protein
LEQSVAQHDDAPKLSFAAHRGKAANARGANNVPQNKLCCFRRTFLPHARRRHKICERFQRLV